MKCKLCNSAVLGGANYHDQCLIKKNADRIAELETALKQAIEWGEEGWAYASEYFQEKWNAKGERDELKGVLEKDGE